jgi:hypothetical protein
MAAFAGCTTHRDLPTHSANWGGYSPALRPSQAVGTPTFLELPPVPFGCLVRVYHFPARRWQGAPANEVDWTAFLRSQGMIFPRGGFATYFPATSTLILANTPDQLALLDPM